MGFSSALAGWHLGGVSGEGRGLLPSVITVPGWRSR